MRKIILVLALCICGIASAHAQTSGLNPPPPPVCGASNAGALYTETSTSPNTVWTCSYYNLQYQWVVNPMYGGLVYYPVVPTTCSGALPVFLAGYPTTTMYVCIQGVPTAVAGGGANITSLTGDATATGPGAASTTVTGINGAAIGASINVLSTNASKQVVGATYQNVVNLFGSGSCSGYLKSDGTCSTPSSIPTGTTNQLLYYAAGGNTVTPLTLGTNLSITSGTLNAAGGSAGVTSLNSLTGALSLTSSNSSISITPSGSSIDLTTAAGGGSYPPNPAATSYILCCDSWTSDDIGVLSSTYANVLGWNANSSTPNVAIVTVNSTTGFSTGQVVQFVTDGSGNPTFVSNDCTAAAALNRGVGYGGTYEQGCSGYKILPTGFTSTQFEVTYTGAATVCTSSCGTSTVASADQYVGNLMQKEPAIDGHGTVYWMTPNTYTLQGLASTFTNTMGGFPNGTPSAPVYLNIGGWSNDIAAGETPFQIEGYLSTIFEDAHAKGWIVMVQSSPDLKNTETAALVNFWLRGMDETAANKVTGNYVDRQWDEGPRYVPFGTFWSGNGSLEPAGATRAANSLNQVDGLNIPINTSETGAYIVTEANGIQRYQQSSTDGWNMTSVYGGQVGNFFISPASVQAFTGGGGGSYANYSGVFPNSIVVTPFSSTCSGMTSATNGWCGLGYGANVSNVNTDGAALLFNPSLGASEIVNLSDQSTPVLFQSNGSVTATYFSGSGTPTVAAGTGAGTGPTIDAKGNDQTGSVGVYTGSSPAASAPVLTITQQNACPVAPNPVLTPANAVTAALSGTSAVFPVIDNASEWEIDSNTTALTAGTTYEWNYSGGCGGGQAVPIPPPLTVLTSVALTSSTAVASITSPSVTVPAGAVIVACGAGTGTQTELSSIPVTSSASATWTQLSSYLPGWSAETVYYANFGTSTTSTFTCTPNISIGYQSMLVLSASGALTADASGSLLGGGTGTTSITTGTFSTASANEFAIECAVGSSGGSAITFTSGSIGGNIANIYTVNGTSIGCGAVAFNTTQSNITATINWTTGSTYPVAVYGSFTY